MQKRGAMELSVGTIVVLVLAMTMLIMGIVLVRSIFKGATYNVDVLNEKVKGEINKLFTEESALVLYLPNFLAEAKQGAQYGVAFGIKNLETGTAQPGTFSYTVTLADPAGAKAKCGIESSAIMNWIEVGQQQTSFSIAPGKSDYKLVRFRIPTNSPLCLVRFQIEVMQGTVSYATSFFDLQITS
jgi:hypothetical protein